MKMSENKQLQQQKVIGHNFIETVSINNSVQRGDDAGRDTGVKKKTKKTKTRKLNVLMKIIKGVTSGLQHSWNQIDSDGVFFAFILYKK